MPRPRRPQRPAALLEPAASPLRDRVDLVWGAAASRREGTSLHEFFPDAGVHLVFRRAPGGCRAVLLGPTTARATVERAGDAEYLGVRFLAWHAPLLADLPYSLALDPSSRLVAAGLMASSSLGQFGVARWFD